LTAWAFFGQVEHDFTNNISLVAGLRYNNEHRKYTVDYTRSPSAGHIIAGQVEDDALIPSVSVNFKPASTVLLYAKYSEGYQAPGFTYSPGQQSRGDISFDAERLHAYELGAKTSMFDQRLALNAAAFFYDYNGMQIRSIVGVGLSRVSNAASARIKGVELDAIVALPSGFSLSGYIAYLDARYADFCQPISGGDPIADDPLCAPGFADRSGNRLNMAPPWSFGLSVAHESRLSDVGVLNASASLTFSDESFYLSSANERGLEIHSWVNLVAKAGVTFYGGPQLFVFGRNLTDDRYASTSQRGSPTIVGSNFNEPRTYGAGIAYRF
jgi:iron complex outermembrane receptor protein